MRRPVLAMLLVIALATCCSCAGGGGRQSASRSGSIPSASPSGSPNSQAATPTAQPPSGIIVISQEDSNCVVRAFDPDSAEIRNVATFNLGQYLAPNNICITINGGPGGAPRFSPDFTKLAITSLSSTGGVSVGWIDTAGNFTPVSVSEKPDFGLPTQPSLLGFDSRGDFYYTLDHGNRLEPTWYGEMYRLPPGASTGGQILATIHEVKDSTTIRTVDGWQFYNGSPCLSQDLGTGFYGNIPTPWFSVNGFDLLRIDQGCNQSAGRPIIPTAGKQISKLIWKIDGSKVVFELSDPLTPGATKLFAVDGNGAGTPREIVGSGVSAVLPSTVYFYSWI